MPHPNFRDRDLAHLHPAFRRAAQAVLHCCAEEQLPFRIFEGFRSPLRQMFLYSQGRTRPGFKVTNARPWNSYHQYGLAADFVLNLNGQWSWDASGEKTRCWTRLHQIAQAQGLEPLSFEMPHLQLSGISISDLQAGNYPAEGDEPWAEYLEAMIVSWNGTPLSPPAPLILAQRPPLSSHLVNHS